jgi:acetylornithine deacetylase/succinyl-diaminopimelate desuccinylase-like protein
VFYNRILLTGLLLFSYSLLISQELNKSELIKTQKQIIAQLSGHQTINDGTILKSRGNKKERAIARQYLINLLRNMGISGKRHHYQQANIHPIIDLVFDPFEGENIYGIIPSTNDGDEYVVLGAHFDTEWKCPGAIDNGAGIALISIVGIHLNYLESRNKNVIIIFFDQEEEELNGSRAFAKYLRQENYNVHSVHTVDAIGWDSDGDRAVEIELPSEELKLRYQKIANTVGIPLHFTKVDASDHAAFRALDFNCTGITDEYANGDYTPYKDTAADTYDTVNFEYLASSTNFVFQVIKSILQE